MHKQKQRKKEKGPAWIREQTKAEDILMMIRNMKGAWAGYIRHWSDKRWAPKVSDNPEIVEFRSVRRPSRDEIRAFDRGECNTNMRPRVKNDICPAVD